MSDREKFLEEALRLIEENKITAYEIEQNTSLSAVGVQKIINRDSKRPLTNTLETIISYIKSKSQSKEIPETKKEENLIPLYDDVSTFGSNNAQTDLAPVLNPTEYIDAGTWFGNTKITAAIRHYGESMIEYPNGCILALKEILDFDNVVFGRNYVVETDEIRVTKRIQSNSDNACVTAYSTNAETYPDGKQIHEPFHIKKKKIRRISLVIGRIVKEHSSGSVITL